MRGTDRGRGLERPVGAALLALAVSAPAPGEQCDRSTDSQVVVFSQITAVDSVPQDLVSDARILEQPMCIVVSPSLEGKQPANLKRTQVDNEHYVYVAIQPPKTIRQVYSSAWSSVIARVTEDAPRQVSIAGANLCARTASVTLYPAFIVHLSITGLTPDQIKSVEFKSINAEFTTDQARLKTCSAVPSADVPNTGPVTYKLARNGDTILDTKGELLVRINLQKNPVDVPIPLADLIKRTSLELRSYTPRLKSPWLAPVNKDLSEDKADLIPAEARLNLSTEPESP
jgi:hypothetical protein